VLQSEQSSHFLEIQAYLGHVSSKVSLPLSDFLRLLSVNSNSIFISHLGGIIPFYGSGHSSFAWFVRSQIQVAQTFSALHYGDLDLINKLISSLDGVVLWSEDEYKKTEAGWFHVDQNPEKKPGFACVQGLLNLLPVTRRTGGNVLVAKSHLAFPAHYTLSQCFENFYKVRLEEVKGDDWMEGSTVFCFISKLAAFFKYILSHS
jgi:hypothetical protein